MKLWAILSRLNSDVLKYNLRVKLKRKIQAFEIYVNFIFFYLLAFNCM
jgi:hypothetical protein